MLTGPRPRRHRLRWIGAVLVLAAVAAVTACSGDPVDRFDGPAPNSGTTVASATLTGRVMSVSFMPYPEGSQVARFLTSPGGSASPLIDWTRGFEAFAARLGWPLPEPLPQPRACQRGRKNYTVWVRLDSGQQQVYGPCTRPPVVDAATALLGVGFP